MKKKSIVKFIQSLIGVIVSLALILGFILCRAFNKNDNAVMAANVPINGTILQYFEWYLPDNGTLWNQLSANADDLKNAGFTAVWLPPAYKNDGSNSVGYSPYDLYDLGEFNQKGTVRTKYGTVSQYLNAINSCHNNGLQVYADIVLNHKGGADSPESVEAYEVYGDNRNYKVTGNLTTIGAWTKFNFEGRGNTYSSFKWDYTCFDGVDWDANSSKSGIFLFNNKSWDSNVSLENGNYDYLMYADVDFDNTAVVNELKSWGEWYTNKCSLDGFRLDALKHIKADFYSDWLNYVRSKTGKEMFTVGEYWSGNLEELKNYLSMTNYSMSLFDVPLHYNFQSASFGNGNYDMRYLFNNTLVSDNPVKAVTFVDNHDTQPGQSLQSAVNEWFKMLAYTAILTREGGYPCVFYGDYYGVGSIGSSTYLKSYKNEIDRLMTARTKCAYGTQHDYLDNSDIIGWTREGLSTVPASGLAALITDRDGGSKSMYVGTAHSGEVWYDITGNISETVTINSSGYGNFRVNGGSYSVWVNKAVSGEQSNAGNVNVDNTTKNQITTSSSNNSGQVNNNVISENNTGTDSIISSTKDESTDNSIETTNSETTTTKPVSTTTNTEAEGNSSNNSDTEIATETTDANIDEAAPNKNKGIKIVLLLCMGIFSITIVIIGFINRKKLYEMLKNIFIRK